MDEREGYDIAEFLPYLLNIATESAGYGFQKHYKDRYGLLRAEWRVLFHLGGYGDMTARDICDRSRTHKTKISRAVGALAARRFITRTRLESDRRQEMLALTKTGGAVYRDLIGLAKAYDRKLMARFTADEQFVLRDCLKRLAFREA